MWTTCTLYKNIEIYNVYTLPNNIHAYNTNLSPQNFPDSWYWRKCDSLTIVSYVYMVQHTCTMYNNVLTSTGKRLTSSLVVFMVQMRLVWNIARPDTDSMLKPAIRNSMMVMACVKAFHWQYLQWPLNMHMYINRQINTKSTLHFIQLHQNKKAYDQLTII